jgi:DNA-binding NarL/FixJ family response regulator
MCIYLLTENLIRMTTPICIVTLILVVPTPSVTPHPQTPHEPSYPAEEVHDVFKHKCNIYNLTSREIDIVKLLSKGLSYKEIAAQLLIAVRTVAKHIEKIFVKVRVSNKIELINKLFRTEENNDH